MTRPPPSQDANFQRFVTTLEQELAHEDVLTRTGRVFEVVGTLLRASGLDAKVGELCELHDARGRLLQRAEVVGFGRNGAILSPFGSMGGISEGTLVVGTGKPLSVPVGPQLLGRVISGLGEPIDGLGPLACEESRPVFADPPDPMSRAMIERPLPTGIKIIDGLMTLGEGQRMGIFAPAGVGKSTLMGMLARGAQWTVVYCSQIGTTCGFSLFYKSL